MNRIFLTIATDNSVKLKMALLCLPMFSNALKYILQRKSELLIQRQNFFKWQGKVCLDYFICWSLKCSKRSMFVETQRGDSNHKKDRKCQSEFIPWSNVWRTMENWCYHLTAFYYYFMTLNYCVALYLCIQKPKEKIHFVNQENTDF